MSSPSEALRSDAAATARAKAYFEEFAAEYDEAARDAGWLLNGRLAGAFSGVAGVDRVLDLACGTGDTLAELARTLPGASLVGVDIAPAMVARTTLRVPQATVVCGDLRRFAAVGDPAGFDLVTVIGGFEFTPDLPGLLDLVRRLVAPGGHLVFTFEPVLGDWPSQRRRVETNLGSNGLELTTFRWQVDEVTVGFDGWTTVRSELLPAYRRDDHVTIYGWCHFRRPAPDGGGPAEVPSAP